jgi:hypothetical protein
MTNISSISINAVIGVTILFGALFLFQGTGRQPINTISAPAGESRQLPIEMLRMKVAMW